MPRRSATEARASAFWPCRISPLYSLQDCVIITVGLADRHQDGPCRLDRRGAPQDTLGLGQVCGTVGRAHGSLGSRMIHRHDIEKLIAPLAGNAFYAQLESSLQFPIPLFAQD